MTKYNRILCIEITDIIPPKKKYLVYSPTKQLPLPMYPTVAFEKKNMSSGAEIDEKMHKGKTLDWKALGASQMPYLNGVFYETFSRLLEGDVAGPPSKVEGEWKGPPEAIGGISQALRGWKILG